MSDVPPSDDELVSSYLDTEATPTEVARVESDPRLMARAEEMRAAIELSSAAITIPELDLARIRAAAVATSATTPVVRDIRAAATTRHQTRNRVLVAAAAVVALGIGVTAIQSLDSDDDTSESADAGASDDADAGSSADAGPGDEITAAESAGLDAMSVETGSSDAEEMADDDMADDEDMAAPEADSTDSTDDAADSAASEPSAGLVFRLGETGGFDVLPEMLEPSTSDAELLVQVTAAVAAFRSEGEPGFARLGDPASPPCITQLIDFLNNEGFEMADIATAEVADVEVVVAVASDLQSQLWLITTPVMDCAAITITPMLPDG